MKTTGAAQRVSQLTAATTWPNLKNGLIDEFKTQTPFEELLRRLYNTNFSGSILKFVEDLEHKSFLISNKLMLEEIHWNTILYKNAMNNTFKDVISRKLGRHDITSVTKLKQVVQREGLFKNNLFDRTRPKNNNNISNTSGSDNFRRNNKNVNQNFYPTIYYPIYNSQKPNENNQLLHQEFKKNLNQGKNDNRVKYQPNRNYSSASNQLV